MSKLIAEIIKFEKEKIKMRALIFSARRDREFWKRRAILNIQKISSVLEETLSDPNKDIVNRENLMEMINTQDSELDELIIVSCKLSDIKEIKKDLFNKAKMLDQRLVKIESELRTTKERKR